MIECRTPQHAPLHSTTIGVRNRVEAAIAAYGGPGGARRLTGCGGRPIRQFTWLFVGNERPGPSALIRLRRWIRPT
jgi:hypothetical protein